MSNFIISEEAIHYAAFFLERYAEQSPTKARLDAEKELRKLSNHLLDNLYTPIQVNIVRHPRTSK